MLKKSKGAGKKGNKQQKAWKPATSKKTNKSHRTEVKENNEASPTKYISGRGSSAALTASRGTSSEPILATPETPIEPKVTS